MRARDLLLTFLLLSTVNSVLNAQKPPGADLTGTWKLNLEKSKLSKAAKVQSETIAITCSGESIQMHYISDGRNSTETYIADGKEKTVKQVQGGEVVTKAQWKGPVLIIETTARLKMPDQAMVNGGDIIHTKERWKLSGNGQMLIVEQDDPKVLSVYDKLPL
jgi:hypothetical protein